MKIWYQSAASLDGAAPYQRLLENHITRMCRPDTVVELHGMPAAAHVSRNTKDHIGYLYVQSLNKERFVAGALEAERSGFDAYFVGTLPDIGYEDIRTLVDIPVVAYGHSSMLTAASLGSCVGVVNFADEIDPLIRRNAEHYKLAQLLGPIVTLDAALDDVVGAYEKPQPLIDAFTVAARRAIELGADVIIPGPGPLNVLMAHHGVTRVDEAPVIDSVAVGLKTCELRADLLALGGLRPSRRGYFFERPREELVEHLRNLYLK